LRLNLVLTRDHGSLLLGQSLTPSE
jgi:hypothetical protein